MGGSPLARRSGALMRVAMARTCASWCWYSSMPERVGAAIWTKVKRPDPFRMQFQQPLDGAEALDDALGVVEAIDADAEL